MDAFADPKRQMTENNNKKEKRRKKTYRKNKRDNTGSGGREASWEGEGAWTRVYFNANICLFLNGFCYLLFSEGVKECKFSLCTNCSQSVLVTPTHTWKYGKFYLI